MALEHWYEAAEYVMAQKREIVSPGEDSFFNYEADEKLNALISGSRKLRKVIEHYNLMETPLPRTPSNMLTWIDDESIQEQLQLELSRDQDHENSSDTESFVSASDNAQLEVPEHCIHVFQFSYFFSYIYIPPQLRSVVTTCNFTCTSIIPIKLKSCNLFSMFIMAV